MTVLKEIFWGITKTGGYDTSFNELINSALVLTVAASVLVVEICCASRDAVSVDGIDKVTKRTVFAAKILVETEFATIELARAVVAAVSKVETKFVFPAEKIPESSVIDPVLRVFT